MKDKQSSEELKIHRSAWEKTLRVEVERWGERRKEFFSSSGIPAKSLYTPLDLEEEGNAIFKKFYGLENGFTVLSGILGCHEWAERKKL